MQVRMRVEIYKLGLHSARAVRHLKIPQTEIGHGEEEIRQRNSQRQIARLFKAAQRHHQHRQQPLAHQIEQRAHRVEHHVAPNGALLTFHRP